MFDERMIIIQWINVNLKSLLKQSKFMNNKKLWIVFFLFVGIGFLWSQPKIVSWNIQNFGQSKSDSAVQYMAKKLRDYDVVAIQEVVAGKGGAQAVAKLADYLNRSGAKWDYRISNPTSGNPYKSERYAFLWKTKSIKLVGKPWLDTFYESRIEREPFLATFEFEKKQFTIVNFHALPKKDQPETEIKYFKNYLTHYPDLELIFLGDFNCPSAHSVFLPLKKLGYASAFEGQKTSLKNKATNGNFLASEYDTILLSSTFEIKQCEVIHFHDDFKVFKSARRISDHLPVYVELVWRE